MLGFRIKTTETPLVFENNTIPRAYLNLLHYIRDLNTCLTFAPSTKQLQKAKVFRKTNTDLNALEYLKQNGYLTTTWHGPNQRHHLTCKGEKALTQHLLNPA